MSVPQYSYSSFIEYPVATGCGSILRWPTLRKHRSNARSLINIVNAENLNSDENS